MNSSKVPIEIFSYAKINLFLEITDKRADGFHDIETIMHEINIYDTLFFSQRKDSKIIISCDDKNIPCDNNNLVYKAAELLQKEFECNLGADIKIEKKIPVGGGLGGGSSNCAAAFKALNELWGLNLKAQEIDKYAAQLGSDINFFLYGGTCLCSGRGEKIKKLAAEKYLDFVLIFPEWGISTAEAYKCLSSNNWGGESVKTFAKIWETGSINEITKNLFNRFEEDVFKHDRREKKLYDKLSEIPFKKLCMSGSGSTLYGITGQNSDINNIIKSVKLIKGVKEVVKTNSRLK